MASVASRNIFSYLENLDEEGSLKETKKEEKKSAPAKQAVVPADKSRAKPQSIKRDYPQRGGRSAAPARTDGDAKLPIRSAGREDRPERSSRGTPKRGGRGGGRGHGNRPPRREFDRHSGTGKVDSEKKINQGWADKAVDIDEPEKPAENEEAAAEAEAPAAEPEPEFKSLDDYKAERAAKLAQLSAVTEVRHANEGADESQWKNAVVFAKQEDIFYGGKETTLKAKNKPKKAKAYLEIEQTFNEDKSRRGGKGQSQRKGGRRGDGSRAVDVSDEHAFPDLK